MNSKQFAWLYLIENGVAGRAHGYYGGYKLVDMRMEKLCSNDYDIKSYEVIKAAYLKEIKEIGVDWDKTNAPESDIVSKFTDTFHEPERTEVIKGKIILNNGLVQTWVGDHIEVRDVFDMMEAISNAPGKFSEIFG